ncbi:general stress protein [Priestia sp. SIMBA_032]|uniref:general stress protein n=1 Tax=Priestia sp. SIMBA_032 TaxID=3085775 RepID=UPI00397CAD2D
MPNVQVVERSASAKAAIDEFLRAGFNKDEIYLLTSKSDISRDLANATNSDSNELSNHNFINSDTNILQVNGDESLSKMQSLGISDNDAERYKRSIEKGSIVIVVSKIT